MIDRPQPALDRPWAVAVERPLGRGTLVGVRLPPGDAAVPDDVVARLRAPERRLVEEARGYRRKQLAGGRLAAARAMAVAGLPSGAVARGERGAPLWPAGCGGSLAHKDQLAIAWVAAAAGCALGVDLEEVVARPTGIAPKVLNDRELRRWQEETEERRGRALVRSFATKEAIYKALAPTLRRYIGFDEAELEWQNGDRCTASLQLRPNEGPYAVNVEIVELAVDQREYLVATVEVAAKAPQEEDGP